MAEMVPTILENKIGRRANARARLMLPSILLLPTAKEGGWLVNVSCGGALVRVQQLPSVGSTAIFKFAEFELWCTVVWASGSCCGIRFDAPLPMETVSRLRSFSDNYAEHEQAHSERMAESWVSGQVKLSLNN
jgi:hypothetical protein